jgi:predicted RNase H-like nuclease
MTICIIGIDCATQANKVGLARGFVKKNSLIIDKVLKPRSKESVSDIVTNWIIPEIKTLLAIDAPLGWPKSLGEELIHHSAGNSLNTESNRLFRRDTDKFIKEHVGKQSLDVGADRIARTAHAALKILSEVSEDINCEIPLAWNAELNSNISVIEVYPAATLKMCGYRSDGYKKKENIEQRKEILKAISKDVTFNLDTSLMVEDDDVLDAAICVLSGFYFASNQCFEPEDIK